MKCGATYHQPPTCTPACSPVSATYSPPITCELPVDHPEPMHKHGELTWATVEFQEGQAHSEAVFV